MVLKTWIKCCFLFEGETEQMMFISCQLTCGRRWAFISLTVNWRWKDYLYFSRYNLLIPQLPVTVGFWGVFSVGVDKTFMMDCTIGPLECMHVNKWVQRAHVSSFPASFLHRSVFFPSFAWKFSLKPFPVPFHSLSDMCAECVVKFTYGCAVRHAEQNCAALKAPNPPLWPQWLITFNKAN